MEKLIKDFEIPNKEIEAWKYTDLKRVFEKNNFEPFIKSDVMKPKNASVDSNVSSNIFFDPKINFVIFENGCLKKINITSNNLEIESLNSNSAIVVILNIIVWASALRVFEQELG